MAYVERALFVVGQQGDGKSTQLRSMFCDSRFGKQGQIPTAAKLDSTYAFSNNRKLYLRLTSPHERGETPKEFHEKFKNILMENGGRWNFACPIQPQTCNSMPDAVKTILDFIKRFEPERVRAAFLSPNRNGSHMPQDGLMNMFDQLWHEGVECVSIDARHRNANGLLLADFFDFT